MKLLPIITEQNIDNVSEKLNYFIKNQNQTLDQTNQSNIAFGLYVVCPQFSSINNIASTISLSSMFGECNTLVNTKIDLYINYLATNEDLIENVPETLNYEFLPKIWNIKMYVPVDVFDKFKLKTDRIDNLGALIYLQDLTQQGLDVLKLNGCFDFSLLGSKNYITSEISELDIESISKIIANNTDCRFIFNAEIESLIIKIQELNNVQICVNKTFWSEKLSN